MTKTIISKSMTRDLFLNVVIQELQHACEEIGADIDFILTGMEMTPEEDWNTFFKDQLGGQIKIVK